ncbi:Ig-like domain-containing protein [Hyphobacterium sp.]|uniref:Ig-like domain-containing protein n=1 Tax=Hyphobacterium sp. TaxID=2004662 RepID=UPI003BA9709C
MSFLYRSAVALIVIAAFALAPHSDAQTGINNADNLRDDLFGGSDDPILVTVGGNDFLYAVSSVDHGVMAFSIAANGMLTPVDEITGADSAVLEQPYALESANVGGTTYLFVAARVSAAINVFSIANDGTLSFVTSVSDNGITNINLLTDLAVADVGGTTYLLGVSALDDGVSVFSVAANGTLTNVENVNDAGSLELDGAWGVATAEVGGVDYAFVSGVFDDGVSVFSIGANGTLTNTDNVADSGSLELDAPWELNTVEVGGTTFVVVAGNNDDGLSVFSVAANGTLTNVQNINDNGFLELNGAREVSFVEIGGTTFLYATGAIDDGVSIFSMAANGTLTNVSNVPDTDSIALNGAAGVAAGLIDGSPFVYVTGNSDNGISGFSAAANGILTNIQTLKDNSNITLDQVYDLAVAEVGGNDYLFTAANNDDAVSVLSIAADGSLAQVANAVDDATLEINGVRSVATANVGGADFLFAAGYLDDGVSVFSVAVNGALTNVFNVADDGTMNLQEARSLAIANIGGTDLLFVAGHRDEGVSVFSIAANGTLTNVFNFADDNTTSFDQPTSVSTAVVDGTTYLFVGGGTDGFGSGGGISVFSVAANGTLTNVANTTDGGSLELEGDISTAIAEIGGTTYLFAAGSDDHGVSVFSVAANGSLSNVDNESDNASRLMSGSSAVHAFSSGGTTYLAVTGESEDGITLFSVAANGTLTHFANIADDTTRLLDNAHALTSGTANGTTYLFTGAWRDDGVSVFSVDGVAPTVAVNIVDASLSDADNASNVTFEFSEPVSGFVAGDLTVAGGSISAFTNVDADSWTATFTADDNSTVQGSVTVNAASYTDLAGNAGASGNDTVTVDTVNPTVTVNIVDASLSDADNASNVTFEFSEPVSGFVAGDLTVAGGSISAFTNVDADSWTATFTADDNSTVQGSVTVNAASYTDLAGNAGASGNDTVTVDTVNPTVTVNIVDASLSDADNASNVTFEFSEPVSGFVAGDLTVAGGSISAFTNVDADSWTATFTADDSSTTQGSVTVNAASYTDLAGNAGASGNDTVTVDTVNPTLTAFARNNPATENTDADRLVFNITFSENVANVSANDFDVTGTTATGVLEGSNAAYTLTLTGGDLANLNGTVGLDLAAGQDITDTVGNALGAGEPGTDETYSVSNDAVAPRIVSIQRQSPTATPTNADSVTWRVTFDEDVTNVGSADFSITGTTGSGVLNPVSATVFDLTVSGGDFADLNGTVTLSIAGGQDIQDLAGNALTNTAPTGTNDNTFEVDNSAPLITGLQRNDPERTALDSVSWLIVFDSAMQNLSEADFQITGTTAGLTVEPRTPGNPSEFNVTASGGNLANLNGDITLSINPAHDLTDPAGNALTNLVSVFAPNEPTYTIDNTAPQITSIDFQNPASSPTNADSLTWRVTFNEAVANVTADDFTVPNTTGTVSVGNITGTTVDVTVSGGDVPTFNSFLSLGFAAGQNIADLAGNALTDLTVQSGTNNFVYAMDNTPPGVDIFFPLTAPSIATPTATWSLSFFDSVSNLSVDDFEIVTSANITASNARIENYTAPSASARVLVDLVSTDGLPGTAALNLRANTDVIDTLGNGNGLNGFAPAFTGVNNNNRFNVDLTAPTVVSVVADSVTSQDILNWRITFSENVSGASAGSFTVNGTTAGPVLVNTIDNIVDITVSGGDLAGLNGDVSLGLTGASVIVDGVGNPLASLAPVGGGADNRTVTIDNTAPQLLAFERLTPFGEQTNADSLTFIVNFNEAVTNVDAADFTVNGTTTATITDVSESAGAPDDGGPVGIASSPTSFAYEVTISGGDLASFTGVVGLDLAAAPTITDAAGNALPAGEPGTDQTYDVRNQAPALASITRLTPTDSTTNADSLTWRLTFAQIDGTFTLPANAFTVTGTDASVTNVSRFSIGLDVTVSGGSPGNGIADLNGDVTLGLANTDFSDDYGNVMDRTIPAGAELTYTLDNTAPSINLFKAGAGSPFTTDPELTIAFSEDVTGFTLDDIVVSGATLSGFRANNARFYFVTVNRVADGNFTVDIPAGVATDAGGNPNQAATQYQGSFDTTPPVVVLSTSATEPVTGNSFDINIDFAEDVTGLSEGDFVVVNGSTNNLAGGPQNFTMEIRPTSGAAGNVTIDLPAGGVEDAAELENTASNQLVVAFDREAPTLTSIVRQSPANESIGSATAQVVFRATFSEGVTNVDVNDWEIRQGGGGTITNVSQVSSNVYDITYTLQNAAGTIEMGITQSGNVSIEDTAGNALVNEDATGTTDTYQRDTSAPITTNVVLDTAGGSPTASDTLTWTVSFNEDMANASADDFALSGTTATITNLTIPSASSVTVTASGGDLSTFNGAVTLSLAAGSDLSDLVGNPLTNLMNSGTDQRTVVLDNAGPVVTIAGPAGPIAGAFTATFNFSEDITGFELGDIVVGNGAASNIQDVSTLPPGIDAPQLDGNSFTATITPAGDGDVTVNVAAGAVNDVVGNASSAAAQFQVTNDQTGPTGYTFEIDQDPINIANVGAVSITFGGFEIGSAYEYTLSSSGGGTPLAGNGVAATEGGTLPSADASGLADGTITATVTLTDALGNAGDPVVDVVIKDTVSPTLTAFARSTPATEQTDADTLVFAITFSESVANVSAEDFEITGTTATGVLAGAGAAYTLTLSGGDLANLNGVVGLNLAAGQNITDAAGNPLAAGEPVTDETFDVLNDAEAPRVARFTRGSPFLSPTAADALSWEIRFNEDVQNVDAGDFAISGTTATVTGLVASDARNFTVTISGGDLDNLNGTVTLDFAAGQDIQDLAGNALTDTSSTGTNNRSFFLDHIAPTATISGPDGPVSGVFAISIEFSEFVEAITAGDLTVTNGSIANFVAADTALPPGIDAPMSVTYERRFTADVTPDGDGEVAISLASGSFRDVALNPNTAAANFSITADGTAPRVTRFARGEPFLSPTASDTLNWTIQFGEPVQNVDAADFAVDGTTATVTNVTASDARNYTVTVSGGDLDNLNGTVTLDFAVGQDIADLAGNALTDTSSTGTNNRSFFLDHISPTASITGPDGPINAAFTVNIEFSEFVESIDLDDITVTNGTAANLAVATDAPLADLDSPSSVTYERRYTVEITPESDGDVIVALAAGSFRDVALNANSAEASFTVARETTAPRVSRIVRAAPTLLSPTREDSLNWSVRFSEDVVNVDAGDFAVTGSTATVTSVSPLMQALSAPVSVQERNPYAAMAVSNNEFTVTIGGGDLEDLTGLVSLTFSGNQNVTDKAGNALTDTTPTGTNANYFYLDHTGPVPSFSSDQASPASGAFVLEIDFDEYIDASTFTLDDLAVTNGVASNLVVRPNPAPLAMEGIDSPASVTLEYQFGVTITPSTNGPVTVNMAADAVTDFVGNPSSAASEFTITNDESRTLTVSLTGVGRGEVSSNPVGIDCGGDCSETYALGASVTLTADPENDSSFASWTAGPCTGSTDPVCVVTMTTNQSVTARFTLDSPPDGRIVASILPGARSGVVGGSPLTAFLTVISQSTSPAQSCALAAPDGAPATISYQALDGANMPTGPIDPLFDLPEGGALSFVLSLTPTAVTPTSGYEFLPVIDCQNASLDPIVGVSSLLLNISAQPQPDIVSASATASGDGVIRIANPGGVGAMSASSINIGAGDGSAAAGQATITVTADTGAASLPLQLEVCQIDQVTAQCLTPRGASATVIFDPNVGYFFAVFVRDQSTGGIAFDPANARVFLRFRDANGALRSSTSAAVTSPAPSTDVAAPEASALQGRWSVLMRQPDGIWPGLARTDLFVGSGGVALVANDNQIRRITLGNALVDWRTRTGEFSSGTLAGTWRPDGTIRAGQEWADETGAFWGVRDQRSESLVSWPQAAGLYGSTLHIGENGEVRGLVAGCAVYASPSGLAGAITEMTLSGCSEAGSYHAVIDLPANENDAAAILIANEARGWRLTVD